MAHLVKADVADIKAIAQSNTTAVLLPAADFYLQIPYPKARDFIECGARLALATDFNPGSSPTQDLSFVGLLARLEMKMTLPEVISAYTLGVAYALNLQAERGSLVNGKFCDFIVLDGSYQDLFYSCGHHPVKEVWSKGQNIHKNS